MARKPTYKLWLVIDEEQEADGALPYDLDNSNPWPLGTYRTQDLAIQARNAMVVVDGSDGKLLAERDRLLKALQTVVRQIQGGHPVGHDAFLAARSAVNAVTEGAS